MREAKKVTRLSVTELAFVGIASEESWLADA
jgi:hypothetical protein